MSQQLTINLLCILIFFTLHYSIKLENSMKKPLFYVIIKVQRLLKQNRGSCFFMSIYSINEANEKIKRIINRRAENPANDTKVKFAGKMNGLMKYLTNATRDYKNPQTVQAHKEKLQKSIARDEELQTLPKLVTAGEKLVDKSASGKPRKWEQHKADSLKLHELYTRLVQIDGCQKIISPTRLEQLAACGQDLHFVLDKDGNKKLARAYFCRMRLCPMCQWRRSLKLFGQVSRITAELDKQNPDVAYLFVTFTQKNVDGSELGAEITRLQNAFSIITAKHAAKKKVPALAARFKRSYLGYIKSVEVTYNPETFTYHPHLHVVFAVRAGYFKSGNYLRKSDWIALWAELLSLNYAPQVDVKRIKGDKQKAVAELAKYPAKTTSILNLPEEQALSVLQTFLCFCNKRRFVSFGGCFLDVKRQLHLQDVEASNANLIDVDQTTAGFTAVGRALYTYNARLGCYVSE